MLAGRQHTGSCAAAGVLDNFQALNPNTRARRHQRAQRLALGAGRAPHQAHLPGGLPPALCYTYMSSLPQGCHTHAQHPAVSDPFCSLDVRYLCLLIPALPIFIGLPYPDTRRLRTCHAIAEIRLARVVQGRLAGACGHAMTWGDAMSEVTTVCVLPLYEYDWGRWCWDAWLAPRLKLCRVVREPCLRLCHAACRSTTGAGGAGAPGWRRAAATGGCTAGARRRSTPCSASPPPSRCSQVSIKARQFDQRACLDMLHPLLLVSATSESVDQKAASDDSRCIAAALLPGTRVLCCRVLLWRLGSPCFATSNT
jgi:hypothetical protein